MIIDNKKLHETTLKKIKLLANDEHFYIVPGAEKYALSTYGRLFRTMPHGGYSRVNPMFVRGEEAYQIYFDNKPEPDTVTIRKLMAMVFFADHPGVYLVNPKFATGKFRWRLDDLHVLYDRGNVVEYILSRTENRDPAYADEQKGSTFINRADFDKPLRKQISSIYWGMHSRATNPGLKKRHPQYQYTTIDPELSLEKFTDWYLDNWYDYPGKLVIDKDILGFGRENCYKLGFISFVPQYINNVFVASNSKFGYCITEHAREDGEKYYKVPGNAFTLDGDSQKNIIFDNYAEALQAGRKRKADYIRAIVAKERAAGYMPPHILDAMARWANLCELGRIPMWEPSEDTLAKLGII